MLEIFRFCCRAYSLLPLIVSFHDSGHLSAVVTIDLGIARLRKSFNRKGILKTLLHYVSTSSQGSITKQTVSQIFSKLVNTKRYNKHQQQSLHAKPRALF